MFVTTANEAYALDARTGRPIWHYTRPLTKGVIGDAGGAINRGVAVLGDRVFMVTDHAHLIALSRLTGKCCGMWPWRIFGSTTARPAHRWWSATWCCPAHPAVMRATAGSSPRITPRLVTACGDSGRCPRAANRLPRPGRDARSNTDAWRRGSPARTTRQPRCSIGRPAIPAPTTTATSASATICTRAPSLALDPGTGTLRWYYQFTPHNLHDWDATETLAARRRRFSWAAAQAAGAGQPQRVLLCLGPDERTGPAGEAVRTQSDLVEWHRRRWPSRRPARIRPDRARHQGVPIGRGRDELDVHVVQSSHALSIT